MYVRIEKAPEINQTKKFQFKNKKTQNFFKIVN